MLYGMTSTFSSEYHFDSNNLILWGRCSVLNFLNFFFYHLFRNIKFNYCILDEGHVIKNGKTKLSKAIKQLAANFRIILSGTPIQVRCRLGYAIDLSVDIVLLSLYVC